MRAFAISPVAAAHTRFFVYVCRWWSSPGTTTSATPGERTSWGPWPKTDISATCSVSFGGFSYAFSRQETSAFDTAAAKLYFYYNIIILFINYTAPARASFCDLTQISSRTVRAMAPSQPKWIWSLNWRMSQPSRKKLPTTYLKIAFETEYVCSVVEHKSSLWMWEFAA